ncbi:MAG: hypothetical protein Q8K59_06290 [Nitrosomonas sp.]|nr:hypothetical protein [Nitrosomonas sp.]MDP1950692.1 hypothetical protein [Nitrosomonas sp.]
MKRLFWLLQILSIAFPVIIFFAYVVMAEGDQFTSEHYMMTGLSAVPFVIVQLLKFLMSGVDAE